MLACPQNAAKQYEVWAQIAIRNGMAELNPNFDPDKPYDEMIIWYPEALSRLLSMDETDVRTDQTKRGHSAAARSVRTQEAGSRCGHGKGKRGREPGKDSAAGSAPPRKKAHRGGFADNKKEGGKMGSRPGELDKGDALVTKSAAKISFASQR